MNIRERIAAAEAQVREPASLEQREAGTYQKGHFFWNGLGITLESAKGMERKGKDRNGKAWSIKLKNSYGYIKGTRSAEPGDQMDVFVGDDPEIALIYVVDQNRNDTGVFDEHKCIIGCANSADAKNVYLSNYSPGWKGFRAVTALTVPQFRSWLEHGDMTKPLKGQEYSQFLKKADINWQRIGETVRKQMPGFHPYDSLIGALLGGVPSYFMSRRRSRWRNALLGALVGGAATNVAGDRARRYLSNIVPAAGYDPTQFSDAAKSKAGKGFGRVRFWTSRLKVTWRSLPTQMANGTPGQWQGASCCAELLTFTPIALLTTSRQQALSSTKVKTETCCS